MKDKLSNCYLVESNLIIVGRHRGWQEIWVCVDNIVNLWRFRFCESVIWVNSDNIKQNYTYDFFMRAYRNAKQLTEKELFLLLL